jgi:hypothetical protein
MSRSKIAGLAIAGVLVLFAVAAVDRALKPDTRRVPPTTPAITPANPPAATGAQPEPDSYQGFIYGRITTIDGSTLTGRLRWGGGNEEAFWGDYFNGAKHENPWVAQVPASARPKERHSVELFGFKIAERERNADLGRQLMTRFGDIARIDASALLVRVTLKSGSVFELDRSEASDFDDDLHVWDTPQGIVLNSLRIVSIEFLPTPPLAALPDRLHGTVRTKLGEFTGFVQWDRDECLGPDELDGTAAEGKVSLRFDTIRSIARQSAESALVTLKDGRELTLSGTNDVGRGNRGMYVDDRRYGRVLISWDAFERIDFSAGGSGPAYGDFPPGSPITGTVTTGAGRRLTGRMAYDLDESETTETLDASFEGVDYTIPFGLVASIVKPERGAPGDARARVTLHNGELLLLACTGDLGERNAGILIFADGSRSPEYVPWADVWKVELDRPLASYPPLR